MAEKGVKPTVEKKQDKKAKPTKAKPEKKQKAPKKPKPPKPEKKPRAKKEAGGSSAEGGNKKKLILVIVIVVLAILVGVGGFFAWKTIQDDKKAAAAADEPSESQPIKTGFLPTEEKEFDVDTPESSDESGSSEEQDAPKNKTAPSDALPASPEELALSVETAQEAVTATVEAANLSAMLGAGVNPSDIKNQSTDEGKASTDKQEPNVEKKDKTNSSSAADSNGPRVVAGSHPQTTEGDSSSSGEGEATPKDGGGTPSPTTSSSKKEEVKDFKFSEETLSLPSFTYRTSDSLEAAVHRDVQKFLGEKDSRPGVQMESVIIGAKVPLPNGGTRVLTYVLGTRYAVADNTLFDYGSLAGPCAFDYTTGGGGYQLKNIQLAHSGDAFEDSVRAMCGDRQDVAEKMIKQSYNLELRGQMLRNISDYIRGGSIPVEYFRMAGQVYNNDGTVYLDKTSGGDSLPTESSSQEATSGEGLEEEYQYYKDLPQ